MLTVSNLQMEPVRRAVRRTVQLFVSHLRGLPMSENQSQVENQSQEVVETLPALKSWVVHCCTCNGDFQITVPTLKVLRYCPFCGDKMLHAFERGRAEGMTNYPNRIPNPDDCVRDVVDRICQK